MQGLLIWKVKYTIHEIWFAIDLFNKGFYPKRCIVQWLTQCVSRLAAGQNGNYKRLSAPWRWVIRYRVYLPADSKGHDHRFTLLIPDTNVTIQHIREIHVRAGWAEAPWSFSTENKRNGIHFRFAACIFLWLPTDNVPWWHSNWVSRWEVAILVKDADREGVDIGDRTLGLGHFRSHY